MASLCLLSWEHSFESVELLLVQSDGKSREEEVRAAERGTGEEVSVSDRAFGYESRISGNHMDSSKVNVGNLLHWILMWVDISSAMCGNMRSFQFE